MNLAPRCAKRECATETYYNLIYFNVTSMFDLPPLLQGELVYFEVPRVETLG
jgi:hypothetical protein